MSEDTGATKPGEGEIELPEEGEEAEGEGGIVDPITGEPFPKTPEGKAAKKAYLDQRRNERHPHGGPPGQSKKGEKNGGE